MLVLVNHTRVLRVTDIAHHSTKTVLALWYSGYSEERIGCQLDIVRVGELEHFIHVGIPVGTQD